MLYICIFSNKLDLNQANVFLILVHSDFLGILLPTPCILHKFKKKCEKAKHSKPTNHVTKSFSNKWRDITVKKWNTNNRDNDKLQASKPMLLLQEVQSSARQMPYQDARQPTLHRQQRKKILAEKIHWWNNAGDDFTDLSIDKICHTFERQQGSAATTDTQPMRGLTGHLQQAVRNLCARRKNSTENQCHNWKSNHVMVIRHWSRHHLHEQQIL